MQGTALRPTDSAAVDGLRGLAALMVVASHASNMGLHWIDGFSLAGTGKYGVFLFFVISAFLLTHQWLRAPVTQQRSWAFLGGYLLRRVLRIYPLYATVLLIGWLLPPRGLGVPLSGLDVWEHLTLRAGKDLYWSVPVEFQYYLVIPFLAIALAAPIGTLGRAAVLGLSLAIAVVCFPANEAPLNSIVLGYYLPVFLFGSAAAWIFHGWKVPVLTASRWRGVADAVALIALLATVPAVMAWFGGEPRLDALHRSFFAWGLAWTLLLLAVLRGWLPGWAAVLRWRGLRACGRWCFGIYLLHMPALYLAKMLPLPQMLKGWAGLVIGLAVAALAHRVVERPAMRFASKVTRAGRLIAVR
jgi:peptidoglycan/LPS O-acetylase OafA/YrhL